MSDIRHPLAIADKVAAEWLDLLGPHCERVAVAGSVRRRKSEVKDVELIYVPRYVIAAPPGELLPVSRNAVDMLLDDLLLTSALSKRPNTLRNHTWGPQIKLAIDGSSGIPLDLFSTTIPNWYSYLICRTGSAAHNVRLASRALSMGYKWNPYNGLQTDDEFIHLESEQHLYDLLKLPYLTPNRRSE